LITGGTSGIGQAFAKEFYNRGNKVIICGRRTDRLQQMQAQHPGMIVKQCDILDNVQRISLIEEIIAEHPDLNILMNNAGVQLVTDLTKPADMNEIRREVETNFFAPVHLATLVAQHFASRGNCAIINISSGLAYAPIAFMPVYCATKAAIHSLTLSLRHQLKNMGVRVFEIAPPSTDTELGHERRADKSQSHGGIPVQEFLDEAILAIEQDIFDAPIGQAKNIKAKGDDFFNFMNH